MRVHFASGAWDDYLHWYQNDQAIFGKLHELIEDVKKTPFQGLGKPEPLKGDLAGWWSRRISGEHRLVYAVEGKKGLDQRLTIAQCRYHY